MADDVSTALESVSTAVVRAHSGRPRGRGYVEASDAAWELLAPRLIRSSFDSGNSLTLACRRGHRGGRRRRPGLSQASGDDGWAMYFEPDFVTEKGAEVLTDMEELSLDVEGLGTCD